MYENDIPQESSPSTESNSTLVPPRGTVFQRNARTVAKITNSSPRSRRAVLHLNSTTSSHSHVEVKLSSRTNRLSRSTLCTSRRSRISTLSTARRMSSSTSDAGPSTSHRSRYRCGERTPGIHIPGRRSAMMGPWQMEKQHASGPFALADMA